MTDGEFKNNAMERALKQVLAEETVKFLSEHREEIVDRAAKRLKEEAAGDDKEALSKLD